MSLKTATVRRLRRFTQIKEHIICIATAPKLVNKNYLYLLVNPSNLRNLRIELLFPA